MTSAAASAAEVQQLLHYPLSFVQQALSAEASKAASSSADLSSLPAASVRALHTHLSGSNWGVEAALERVLGLHEPRSSAACHLALIPSLNDVAVSSARDSSHLHAGQLVRFRGMVQETMQPEIYAGLYQAQAGEHKQSEPQPFTIVSTSTHTSESEEDIPRARC